MEFLGELLELVQLVEQLGCSLCDTSIHDVAHVDLEELILALQGLASALRYHQLL